MSIHEHHPFRSTHLSIVEGASRNGVSQLEGICEYYDLPLKSHLRRTAGRRYGLASHELDDILQSFMLAKILKPQSESHNVALKFLEKKERSPSTSFRGYLVRSLNNFVIEYLRKNKNRNETELVHDPGTDETAIDTFMLELTERSLELSLDGMKEQCERDNRNDVWAVFKARIVDPLAANERPPSLLEVAARLGLKDAKTVSNLLGTAKRRFRKIMRDCVVQNVPRDETETEASVLERELGNLLELLPHAKVMSPGGLFTQSVSFIQLIQPNDSDPYTVEDYAAIWADISGMRIEEFVAEVAPSLKPKFRDVVVWGGHNLQFVRDLWRHPSPPIDLLQSIKAFAKRTGSKPTPSHYPYEINVVLYHAAIASCWIKEATIITRDKSDVIGKRLPVILNYEWLDESMRELFTAWQEKL